MIAHKDAIEKYEIAAIEFEMIARLATTDFRREMYELLASEYRKLATDLASIAGKAALAGSEEPPQFRPHRYWQYSPTRGAQRN